jgi:hypothetical protein
MFTIRKNRSRGYSKRGVYKESMMSIYDISMESSIVGDVARMGFR